MWATVSGEREDPIVDSKALAMLKIMRLVEKKKKARYEKRYKSAAKKAS